MRCPYSLRVVNAEDPADTRPAGFSKAVYTQNNVADIYNQNDFTDETDEYSLEIFVNSGLEPFMGEYWLGVELRSEYNYYEPISSPLRFEVKVECDANDAMFPRTPTGSKCPNSAIDWCGLNYKEDAAGSRCAQYDPCVANGDGSKTKDDFGNRCPDTAT